jgi:hypothetical protein
METLYGIQDAGVRFVQSQPTRLRVFWWFVRKGPQVVYQVWGLPGMWYTRYVGLRVLHQTSIAGFIRRIMQLRRGDAANSLSVQSLMEVRGLRAAHLYWLPKWINGTTLLRASPEATLSGVHSYSQGSMHAASS